MKIQKKNWGGGGSGVRLGCQGGCERRNNWRSGGWGGGGGVARFGVGG